MHASLPMVVAAELASYKSLIKAKQNIHKCNKRYRQATSWLSEDSLCSSQRVRSFGEEIALCVYWLTRPAGKRTFGYSMRLFLLVVCLNQCQ